VPQAAAGKEVAQLVEMRRRLLRWYRVHRRDLPWRRNRDAYRVWISEIMLQQTRVDVVVPYFEKFIRRFPDVRALAAASLEDVLHAWSGLGYYTRARHLHAAARRIVAQHAARMPDDVEAVRALPGIGPYTAGAICSIAFGRAEPILDGNVKRVLARWLGIDGDIESRAVLQQLWNVARQWARGRSPGDANQALMELGATLCTKPTPACDRCPVRACCNAFATGRAGQIPLPRKRPELDTVHLAALLVRQRGRLLLVRRNSGRLLQDWWEIPTRRATRTRRSEASRRQLETLAAVVGARLGVSIEDPAPVARARHAILAHRIEVDVVCATVRARRSLRSRATTPSTRRDGRAPRPTPLANLDLVDLEVRWVEPRTCRRLPLTTLARKALHAAARVDSAWSEYLEQDVGKHGAHQRRAEPAHDDVEQGVRIDGANAFGEADAEHRTRKRL
jgi:A/G-specific adenine glycosylase